jgi:hypothetical protein
MPFKGHTPRQHRAASSRGGRSRMKRVTYAQQLAWGKKGGEATRKFWAEVREAKAQALRDSDVADQRDDVADPRL